MDTSAGRAADAESPAVLFRDPEQVRSDLLGPLLILPPDIDALYEKHYAANRIRELRGGITVGLVLYSTFNFTSIVLLPDVLTFSVLCRTLGLLPVGLFILWAVKVVSAKQRERLLFGGMTLAYAFPVMFLQISDAEHAFYSFSELILTMAFGNMLLCLRFRYALLFTAIALAATLLVIWFNAPSVLRFPFATQIVTSCVFTLYANYNAELRRCQKFLDVYLAESRAEALEVSRRHLLDLSRTDVLTGLPNRRRLEEVAEKMFASGEDVSVMMIDLDHFKEFNDMLGHPAGDDCLRLVADQMQLQLRGMDGICARYGGEEFSIIVSGLSELSTVRLARLLVTSVEALGIPHPGRGDGISVVTVSIGVAPGCATKGGSLDCGLTVADRALYSAKSRGRNGYCLSTGECFRIPSCA